ncbi:hypothetical protein L2E82_16579 [Cichorium intybus]|uniref:Uncharacterized protein n=1 Tax=Cichorium intybus TaxID=13427 RepID=A0ACB9F6I9_CICIN|nr:hypothetical protein L2E82_16579 [Cichorium intybus]
MLPYAVTVWRPVAEFPESVNVTKEGCSSTQCNNDAEVLIVLLASTAIELNKSYKGITSVLLSSHQDREHRHGANLSFSAQSPEHSRFKQGQGDRPGQNC